MLQVFFPDNTPVSFQSSPFPLDPSVEMLLFAALPLTDEENEALSVKYHGAYNHWTGGLLHIADKSRADISYCAMRLSGYNNCPTLETYKTLYQCMCYLYHHPLVPIMFPRNPPSAHASNPEYVE